MWADCEALERRHNLPARQACRARVEPEARAPSCGQRRAMPKSLMATDAVFSGDTSRAAPGGAVVLTPTMRAEFTCGCARVLPAAPCRQPRSRLRLLRGRRDEAGGVDLPGAVAVGDGGVQGVGEAPVSDLKRPERKRPVTSAQDGRQCTPVVFTSSRICHRHSHRVEHRHASVHRRCHIFPRNLLAQFLSRLSVGSWLRQKKERIAQSR